MTLIPEFVVARLGLPLVALASLPVVAVCGRGFAVTILVNVDFGGMLAVFVLTTTDVVTLGKRAVVDMSVSVEAEDVEVLLA